MMTHELRIKRAYLPAEPSDGWRILIDRLWPRGLKKTDARLDEWCKTIAPTDALRRWFGHADERFALFAERYRAELAANPDAEGFARQVAQHLEEGNVTLVYGARNPLSNHAIVLRDWLLAHA